MYTVNYIPSLQQLFMNMKEYYKSTSEIQEIKTRSCNMSAVQFWIVSQNLYDSVWICHF